MLTLDAVGKTFVRPDGTATEAVRETSMQIRDGEFVAVVGPSGCGKTTLLRMIAGLDRPTSGRIDLDGETIAAPDRQRGMVFQHFTSFPWLSVEDNMAFGLRLRGTPEDVVRETVEKYLELTGLEQFRSAYPSALSGGMQQRLAIARTLANGPKMLLLDEPFGALDAQTRSQMQEFLAQLWERERKTVVLVTHDVKEACFLADRVLVLRPRPASVAEEIIVPFPRPRTHGLKMSPDLFALEAKILRTMEH